VKVKEYFNSVLDNNTALPIENVLFVLGYNPSSET
jgi:hypothetical protein